MTNTLNASPLRIALCGLSLTSSSLMRELARRGHEVWETRAAQDIREADCVLVASSDPDSLALGLEVTQAAQGITAFYDLDTAGTLAKLARGEPASISAELIPAYDLYLSSTGGAALKTLEQRYGARRARALLPAVDAELFYPQESVVEWDLGYLGTYNSARQLSLNRLLLEPVRRWPEGKFVLAGSEYPPGIAWPPNVAQKEPLPESDYGEFYHALRFALNITGTDQPESSCSPTVHLLEAAACGTPIISDYWDGLEAFFALGTEILIAYSPDSVLRYLTEMSDAERAGVSAAARARVLRQHTVVHRAAELEGYLREALAAK